MGMVPMTGEALHDLGREGARRAKHWLESTSRVDACWVNPDKGAAQKLTFGWPEGGHSFSFDLGGKLRYGDFDGQLFYAEVKKYSAVGDLNAHYKAFLAKCYVAYLKVPNFADHFMWVSWTPHGTSRWATLTSTAEVRAAVIEHADRIFPAGTDPVTSVDEDACKAVSDRLWLLILSNKQESLVPFVEHLELIHSHELRKAMTP
ncbi:hypothetical protein [Raineyella sp. W15-4]|uniref:hypothetical protein n=1 Tax=Raineyella sp. W15-4 TaxID=3081651 RepID=UPI0029544740|nr:hypothetical protein [Raineyella sp. W15-4]WOQ17584.1 hypothetical protein R0145_02395 [Raineyella sp. W15-4]